VVLRVGFLAFRESTENKISYCVCGGNRMGFPDGQAGTWQRATKGWCKWKE